MGPVLQQVLEQYPKEVKVVFKQFPLAMHKNANSAAIAALAAGEQGKFWEYHDKLFQNSSNLSDQVYLDLAQQLGLDVEKFKKSLTDPRHQQTIAKDMSDGMAAGVSGTPTIYLNGRKVGDRSLQGYKNMIEAELKKKRQR